MFIHYFLMSLMFSSTVYKHVLHHEHLEPECLAKSGFNEECFANK